MYTRARLNYTKEYLIEARSTDQRKQLLTVIVHRNCLVAGNFRKKIIRPVHLIQAKMFVRDVHLPIRFQVLCLIDACNACFLSISRVKLLFITFRNYRIYLQQPIIERQVFICFFHSFYYFSKT